MRTANIVDGFVPVIDLGVDHDRADRDSAAFATAIAHAFSSSGFVVVTGHGVPEKTIADMYAAVRRFFALPAAEKARVASDPLDPLQRGYLGGTRMELFSVNRLGEPPHTAADSRLHTPNRWPTIPGFRETYLAYYARLEELAGAFTRSFALALGLDERWFDDKFDRHMTPLTANYYPPLAAVSDQAQRRLRNEAHRDFTALTVLYQDDAPGGLQVLDRERNWHDVPHIPGSFVVNIGQLMERWTNGRWPSTVHRVVNPGPEHEHLDRVSIAFFYQPNPDTVVECIPTCTNEATPPRHQPVTASEYFIGKARRAYVRARRAAS